MAAGLREGLIGALGIEFLAARDGWARARMRVDPVHLNPIGRVHGGAICSLVDTAMGFALYPVLAPRELAVTLEMRVHYLTGAREGALYCEARVRHRTRHVAVLEATVTAEDGTPVAWGSGTFYIRRVGEPGGDAGEPPPCAGDGG